MRPLLTKTDTVQPHVLGIVDEPVFEIYLSPDQPGTTLDELIERALARES